MSKWMSEIISEKRRRQANGPQTYGHLQVFEGSKIEDGRVLGETLLDRILQRFQPKTSAPQLRVLKWPDAPH